MSKTNVSSQGVLNVRANPSPTPVNVPNCSHLYKNYQGVSDAFEKVVFFDNYEPYSARLFDSFMLPRLPRCEVRHCNVEDVLMGGSFDAIVIHLPESKRPESMLTEALEALIVSVYHSAGHVIPPNWLKLQLARKYLENSFDYSLPINHVFVLPFGPEPELIGKLGFPSYIFGVSIWRLPLGRYGIKDALKAVFQRISAHNQKLKRKEEKEGSNKRRLVKRVAIPTFCTAMVDHTFGGEALEPAGQMAIAYLEYLQARGVPNCPQSLQTIENPLPIIVSNSTVLPPEQIAARGLVNLRELHELLALATNEKGGETREAAERVLQIILTRKDCPPRLTSDRIIETIAERTVQQIKDQPPPSKGTFGSFFSKPPPPIQTTLSILLQRTIDGHFQPWKPISLKAEFEEQPDSIGKIAGGGGGMIYQVTRKSDRKRFVKKAFGLDGESKSIANKSEHADQIRISRSEVGFMSLLRHEHLASCIGANLEPPNQFVIMIMADLDLYRLLHDTPLTMGSRVPQDLSSCLRIAIGIAMGMTELHRVDVIHRDLKSPNVLLHWTDNGWHAVITDFGTTRVQKALMTSGVGSELWMAPEVDNGKAYASYTKLADVWSFGVILWELFSRQRPRTDCQYKDLTSVPNSIADLIRKCLQLNPTNRPTSQELITILQGLVPSGQKSWR